MKIYLKTTFNIFLLISTVVLFTSCGKSTQDPGLEYAPQMYVSKAYEPYSQVDGAKNKFNPMGINMRPPAKFTIPRRNFKTTFGSGDSTQTNIMVYNLSKDDILLAEKTLKNPIPLNENTILEGEVLYLQFCSPCHGAKGDGQGKVGEVYKGVANYSGITKNQGHIFHVITHGKGRMWAHGSQLTQDERWKIVHYVNKLQYELKGETFPMTAQADIKEDMKKADPKKEDPKKAEVKKVEDKKVEDKKVEIKK